LFLFVLLKKVIEGKEETVTSVQLMAVVSVSEPAGLGASK
jgi:hypothetical protein